MDIEVRVWLHDVLTAINEIDSYFIDKPKTFSSFQQELKTKRAVERNLEIIGEAVFRILNKDNSISISNSRKIIGTRNRIIHGYDNVSDEMLWGIIVNHLPALKMEVDAL